MRKLLPDRKHVTLICLGLAASAALLLLERVGYPPRAPRPPQQAAGRGAEADAESALVWSSSRRDWALAEPGLAGGPAPASARDCVWPRDRPGDAQCSTSDRIVSQLKLDREDPKTFKIALARDYSLTSGADLFHQQGCKVKKCALTHDIDEADAVVFPNADVPVLPARARAHQIWIAHFLESPPNTFDQRFARKGRGVHAFNWTASYRSDADIVTPYAKFVPFLRQSPQIGEPHALASDRRRALIESKPDRVAWFVSNCHAKNNRLEFARELAKHIPVDVYGKCGNLTCDKRTQAECLALVNRNYKFYLAFENSNNRQYITEKLYRNALGYNDQNHLLVPIVMGPTRSDYESLAPPGSFIHVDDFDSPESLAEFLRKLASDTRRYSSYFRWKSMGRFIDTKFMCRLCALLHHSHRTRMTKSIPNVKDWWLHDAPEKLQAG